FFQAEDGIRDRNVTGVQTCALPILENAVSMETKRVQLLPLKKAAFMPKLPVDVQQEIIHMVPSTKDVLDQVVPNYITGNIYGCQIGRASCRERVQISGGGVAENRK